MDNENFTVLNLRDGITMLESSLHEAFLRAELIYDGCGEYVKIIDKQHNIVFYDFDHYGKAYRL